MVVVFVVFAYKLAKVGALYYSDLWVKTPTVFSSISNMYWMIGESLARFQTLTNLQTQSSQPPAASCGESAFQVAPGIWTSGPLPGNHSRDPCRTCLVIEWMTRLFWGNDTFILSFTFCMLLVPIYNSHCLCCTTNIAALCCCLAEVDILPALPLPLLRVSMLPTCRNMGFW